MKAKYTRRIPRNSAPWHLRKFLYRVHRYLIRYFNQDDTLLLNERESFANPAWKIGDYSYGHPTRSPHVVYFGEEVTLEIGKFCCFAEEVTIMLGYGGHRTDWITTYPFPYLFENIAPPPGLPYAKGDIKIGNDVWICTGATIMSGVTVGNGAVLAAQSVVSKDVPSYAIVAGNPARVVGHRFPEDIAEKLNVIRWWDWPIQKIRSECCHMLSSDAEAFVARHYDAAMQLDAQNSRQNNPSDNFTELKETQ